MNVNRIPTTAEMKAALATIQPVPTTTPSEGGNLAERVADTVAIGLAGTVNTVTNAGSNTVSFIDRVRTGYKFQRALQTGKLVLDAEPAPAARSTRRKAR